MLRRGVHFLIIFALLLSIGGHWALLQTAAWAGMVVSYSQEGTFAEALSKTFDGKHPCKLCKIVNRSLHDQQEQDTTSPEKLKKFELFAECLSTHHFGLPRGLADYLPYRAKALRIPPAPLLLPPRVA
jgi:hypothetical protein